MTKENPDADAVCARTPPQMVGPSTGRPRMSAKRRPSISSSQMSCSAGPSHGAGVKDRPVKKALQWRNLVRPLEPILSWDPDDDSRRRSSHGPRTSCGHSVCSGRGGGGGGGLRSLGAAIFSLGVPKDSEIRYRQALKADGFLLAAHGPVEETARAKTILETLKPIRLDLHQNVKEIAEPSADHAARIAAT